MGRVVGKHSYQDILQRLNDVEAWFRTIGIKFASSRFDTYRKNIRRLNQYRVEGRIEEFVRSTDFKEIVFSLYESSEFVTIYGQLKDVDPQCLRERLRFVAKGPAMVDEEDPTRATSSPRDFLFELSMIAILKGSGLEVVFDSHSDVHCVFESKHFLLECKRPQTRNSVRRNFLKAIDQTTKSLNRLNRTNSRGIIALSIGKMLHKGHMFIVGKNKSDMNARLDRIILEAWKPFESLERTIVDTRVIGVFLVLSTPAVLEDSQLLTHVHEIRVKQTCLQGSSDSHLLHRMADGLDQAMSVGALS
ncbi:MAG: hypothetical protein AMJ91_01910 [candidate division Zixibacteria bacterium SM23_73_3]|nr:MAG: hypothetical protein AMJ91_01910 [candidate division Zixibacteria bacterium SM23_73_3]